MSLDAPSTGRPPWLVMRAIGLFFSPCAEWARIDAEPATVAGLFWRFVLPVAAIGPVALAINGLSFDHPKLAPATRWPAVSILLGAVIIYLLSLTLTWFLGMAIDSLAPGFCGCKNRVQAFKVAAYAGAGGWVAGAFAVTPWLAPLVMVGGLYSLFLLYRGLPRLMRAPPERALAYTAATAGVALAFGVLAFIVLGSAGAALSCLTDLGGGVPAAENTAAPPASGDLARLAAAAQQARAQIKAAHGASTTGIISPDRLESLLPDHLGRFVRTDVSGARRSEAGYAATSAQARYAAPGAHITLTLTDLLAARGIAAFAGGLEFDRTKTTANGYKKIGAINGQLTLEQFDRRRQRAQYAVVVADRFLIIAYGDGASMDEIRGAVSAVEHDHLQSLAHDG